MCNYNELYNPMFGVADAVWFIANLSKMFLGAFDSDPANDFETRSGEVLQLDSLQFRPYAIADTTFKQRMNEFLPNGTILEQNVVNFALSCKLESKILIVLHFEQSIWCCFTD